MTLYEDFHVVVEKSQTLTEFRTNLAEIPSIHYEIIDGILNVLEKVQTDKGQLVLLIKYLMMIVETIQGEKVGALKKSEALTLFSKILSYMDLSQRDKKLYMSIFDSTVEMAFWGKQWLSDNGHKWSFPKFLCCKS